MTQKLRPATLTIEHHTFQTPSSGLWVSSKRYTTLNSTSNTEGLTLLFTHCNGSHKEEFDTLVALLFAHQNARSSSANDSTTTTTSNTNSSGGSYQKRPQARIREAWTFDRQNHGDAAVLNARALELREGVASSLEEWAEALKFFIASPLVKGHRLVGIGHSAGATALTLTLSHLLGRSSTTSESDARLPAPNWASLILLEPTITQAHIFNRDLSERMEYMDLVVNLTLKRRCTWASKDAAFEWMKGRLPWGMWDERALRGFVEHALHPHSDVRKGVTLKWTKEQEAASYPGTDPHHDGCEIVRRLVSSSPDKNDANGSNGTGRTRVHLVWGERVEFMPEYLRDALSDPKEGMHVTSVSYVEDAGHMVVQEKPDALAEIIAARLDEDQEAIYDSRGRDGSGVSNNSSKGAFAKL